MTQNADARTRLAALIIGYVRPTFADELGSAWRLFPRVETDPDAELPDPAGGAEREALTAFLDAHTNKVLAEIQPEIIVRTITETMPLLMQDVDLQLASLVEAGDESFSREIGPADSAKVRRLSVTVYGRLDQISKDHQTISRALIVLRRADNALEDLEDAITYLIADQATAPNEFKTLKARESYAKKVTNRVAVWRRRLGTCTSELTSVDRRGSVERDNLHKSLATLNMFTGLEKNDIYTGLKTSTASLPNGGAGNAASESTSATFRAGSIARYRHGA